jgi:hypothetical protein
MLLDHHQRAAMGFVAQGRDPAHPHALGLGGGNLVADPLGGDLALELGEGEQHVERERPMLVVVLNDWVTETKLVPAWSSASTSLAKSSSERVSRSSL